MFNAAEDDDDDDEDHAEDAAGCWVDVLLMLSCYIDIPYHLHVIKLNL